METIERAQLSCFPLFKQPLLFRHFCWSAPYKATMRDSALIQMYEKCDFDMFPPVAMHNAACCRFLTPNWRRKRKVHVVESAGGVALGFHLWTSPSLLLCSNRNSAALTCLIYYIADGGGGRCDDNDLTGIYRDKKRGPITRQGYTTNYTADWATPIGPAPRSGWASVGPCPYIRIAGGTLWLAFINRTQHLSPQNVGPSAPTPSAPQFRFDSLYDEERQFSKKKNISRRFTLFATTYFDRLDEARSRRRRQGGKSTI